MFRAAARVQEEKRSLRRALQVRSREASSSTASVKRKSRKESFHRSQVKKVFPKEGDQGTVLNAV